MRRSFGHTSQGQESFLYTLRAGNLQLDVCDYGASWVNLLVNGRDVLLGYDDVSQYEKATTYFGATVGRVANRIGNAAFILNGQEYHLEANEGTNSLHGGFHGYDKRVWAMKESDERSVTFTLESPSGDQGYPGNLTLRAKFELTDNDEIITTYSAQSDQDTLCNPTNHSFFNLNGSASGSDIENHVLTINADAYLQIDDKLLPTGAPVNVAGTPFDFRAGKAIGRDINAGDEQLRLAGGYDHNYVLNGNEYAAEVYSPVTGLCMRISTSLPGIQFYAGNMMTPHSGKHGEHYTKRGGLALETQFFPDSIHHPEYPSSVLKKGEEKIYTTRYKFTSR